MFTFQFLDFLVVLAGGLLLLGGLTLLALKRRGEILRDLLTPEEPDIEQEFFKRREKPKVDKEHADEYSAEGELDAAADEAGWGVAATAHEEPPQA